MQIIDVDLKLSDNKLLTNMDVQSVLSLNGRRLIIYNFRVAEHIDKKSGINMDNFRPSLQLIKLWAKNKGIYTNKMGYLGGISWAILVSKICQVFYLINRCFQITLVQTFLNNFLLYIASGFGMKYLF